MQSNIIILFTLFFSVLSSEISGIIRLLTFHYNMPHYIELQYKSFRKFLSEEHELIVFNDARDPILEERIRETCKKYGITCIRYEQNWHQSDPLNEKILRWLQDPKLKGSYITFQKKNLDGISKQPSIRHCHVIQYALDNFGYDHDDIVVIMDGDIFPIRNLKLRKLLEKYHIIGLQRSVPKENIDYLWVPFIAIDMVQITNKYDLKFHVDFIKGKLHDTGSHTYHYLLKNPLVNFKKYKGHSIEILQKLSVSTLSRFKFSRREIKFIKSLPPACKIEFHLENHLLHFRNSSFNNKQHEEKDRCIVDYLKEILK